MTNDSVVSKVKKILARAERGSTEHERDTAMRLAQEFMFKHNLDMADIELASDDPGREFTREREDLEHWSGTLLFRIAKVFFCTVYYWPSQGGKTRPHFIVGRRDNVQVVKELHSYIAQQIEGEAMIEVSKRGQLPRYARIAVYSWAIDQAGTPPPDEMLSHWAQEMVPHLKGEEGLALIMRHTGLTKSYASEVRPYIKKGNLAPEIVRDLGVWRRSFLEGASNKVYLRLHEMHRKSVKDTGSRGTDLVRDERASLNAYMKEIGLNLGTGNTSSRLHDPSGANAGSEAGARADISLGNKMGRGGTRLLGS